MWKRQSILDRDQLVTGKCTSSYVVLCDDEILRIDPPPTPTWFQSIIGLALVAATVASLWFPVLTELAAFTRQNWIWGAAFVTLALLLLACFIYQNVKKTPDSPKTRSLLAINRQTGHVALPRLKRSFPFKEVVHFQYITTRQIYTEEGSDKEYYRDGGSELNLVTCINGETKRWPLINDHSDESEALSRVAHKIKTQTPLKVVRVKHRWNSWELVTTDF